LFRTVNPEASTMTKHHTYTAKPASKLQRTPLYTKSLSINDILIFTINEY